MKSSMEKNKRQLTGTVVSNRMANTVVVAVDRYIKYPKYQKFITRTKRFKAHTTGTHEIGDTVTIEECSPISKDKHFKVVEQSA